MVWVKLKHFQISHLALVYLHINRRSEVERKYSFSAFASFFRGGEVHLHING